MLIVRPSMIARPLTVVRVIGLVSPIVRRVQRRVRGHAEPGGIPDHGVEDRTEVSRGAAAHPQNLARGRLLLERLS
jgi:hypothetical protein